MKAGPSNEIAPATGPSEAQRKRLRANKELHAPAPLSIMRHEGSDNRKESADGDANTPAALFCDYAVLVRTLSFGGA